ncbi:DnaJ domain-containing protein [Nemania serpens]|nr:DnaJ domain-containing protein [Nemania serpens]
MDFYKVLEVPRDADTAAIERAFKKLSLTHHPDKANARTAPKGREEGAAERKAREARNHDIFVKLAEARDTLTDPKKRRAYDKDQERERSGKGKAPKGTPSREPPPTGQDPWSRSGKSRFTSSHGSKTHRREKAPRESYGHESYGYESYSPGAHRPRSGFRYRSPPGAGFGGETSSPSSSKAHRASHRRTDDHLDGLAMEIRYERMLGDRLGALLDLLQRSPLRDDPEFFDVVELIEAERARNKRAGRVILRAEVDITAVAGCGPEADFERREIYEAALRQIYAHTGDLEDLIEELEAVIAPDTVRRDHFLLARVRRVFARFTDVD